MNDPEWQVPGENDLVETDPEEYLERFLRHPDMPVEIAELLERKPDLLWNEEFGSYIYELYYCTRSALEAIPVINSHRQVLREWRGRLVAATSNAAVNELDYLLGVNSSNYHHWLAGESSENPILHLQEEIMLVLMRQLARTGIRPNPAYGFHFNSPPSNEQPDTRSWGKTPWDDPE